MKGITIAALCFLTLGLAMNPTIASAEYGTMAKCVSGCLPGSNNCTKCCTSTFSKVQGSCETGCQGTLQQCNRTCTEHFEECAASQAAGCVPEHRACLKKCWRSFDSCDSNCGSIQASFNCPNWVSPSQKCPYDCQVWNPSTRSCVGPHMSGCR